MNTFQGILLGVVQGLTEFLPVSSSGHLSIVSALLGLEPDILFTVVVHLGTLLAVTVAFRKDVLRLVKGAVGLVLDGFRVGDNPNRRLVVLLLVATLPLALGAVLDPLVEEMFGSTLFVGLALIFTAAMLFFADRRGGGDVTASNASYRQAAAVGLSQLIAVFPGVSRSGATISAGLLVGFRRDFATRFAFLLSIPAVAGSFIFELPDLIHGGIHTSSIMPYAAGFLAALVSGYMAIKLVKLLTRKNSFRCFSYYCAAVGALTVVFSMI